MFTKEAFCATFSGEGNSLPYCSGEKHGYLPAPPEGMQVIFEPEDVFYHLEGRLIRAGIFGPR